MIDALMAGLADAVAAGKVRAVGASNFSEMREVHAVLARWGLPLASNQVRTASCTERRRSTGCSMRAGTSASPF
jgi:aryl-alcohol dehydrogenase-like predicted oxidoreductase